MTHKTGHLHRLLLSRAPQLGAKFGVLHEWHFRTGLDHYSALLGMIFALNYPMTAAWMRRVRSSPTRTCMCLRACMNMEKRVHRYPHTCRDQAYA